MQNKNIFAVAFPTLKHRKKIQQSFVLLKILCLSVWTYKRLFSVDVVGPF